MNIKADELEARARAAEEAAERPGVQAGRGAAADGSIHPHEGVGLAVPPHGAGEG